MEAEGKSAVRISEKDACVLEETVEVICHTVGYFSTSNNFDTLMLPGNAMRPRSFRIISTIIKFSARSFREFCNLFDCSWSVIRVNPREAVPFIGRVVN